MHNTVSLKVDEKVVCFGIVIFKMCNVSIDLEDIIQISSIIIIQ
jgi:hypothetical protein